MVVETVRRGGVKDGRYKEKIDRQIVFIKSSMRSTGHMGSKCLHSV
jgi:hypothetical protein